MPVLHLVTCTLRPWHRGDGESLVRHANNPRVARYLRDVFPSPYTPADAEAWLARAVEQSPPRNFAIEVDGEAAGSIGLVLRDDVHRRSAEIGYWLGEAWWGRGIASEAVGAITRYGVEEFDLLRIEAQVFAPNVASARVLEKNGYILEGRLRKSVVKQGEVLDALLYAFVVEG